MKVALSSSVLLVHHILSAVAFAPRSSPFDSRRRKRPTSPSSVVTTEKVGASNTRLYYEPPTPSGDHSVWNVLAKTEEWIGDILGKPGLDNPYKRKEVTYVCEVQSEDAMVLSGIWRRLREARELGEKKGQVQEQTFRQTQVIVFSNSMALYKFNTFDALVSSVNQARRQARDLVTDLVLEKNGDRFSGGSESRRMSEAEEEEMEWAVSINAAHMHPNFGELTPQQQLLQMQMEDKEGEIDENLRAYKEKKLMARRSPYPTLVMEVRAQPPPDFGMLGPPVVESKAATESDEDRVSKEDVQRLEAIFGKSAALNVHNTPASVRDEDAFYDALSSQMEEVSLLSPMILAQNWVVKHDADNVDTETSTFTLSDTQHVDAAYEFVFTNMAMHTNALQPPGQEGVTGNDGRRQYLIMSKFCSNSATSLENFCNSVEEQVNALPELSSKCAGIEFFHPEHVNKKKRGPVPIIAIDWI